jgi:hypothetical protein
MPARRGDDRVELLGEPEVGIIRRSPQPRVRSASNGLPAHSLKSAPHAGLIQHRWFNVIQELGVVQQQSAATTAAGLLSRLSGGSPHRRTWPHRRRGHRRIRATRQPQTRAGRSRRQACTTRRPR